MPTNLRKVTTSIFFKKEGTLKFFIIQKMENKSQKEVDSIKGEKYVIFEWGTLSGTKYIKHFL